MAGSIATQISDIIPIVRNRLIEPQPKFWSDAELTEIAVKGVRDLWRDIADLKQEHFVITNTTDVTFPANATELAGVPNDVHKVYNIEPVNMTVNGVNIGLMFSPLAYTDNRFQEARTELAISPQNDVIYYAIHNAGAPISPPRIFCAPQVTSAVALAFTYVPTLGPLTGSDPNPIPGESDNAIIAWTVAFARAKEREDRAPDPGWLTIYATEKQHLLQSLGVRQYQEAVFAKAMYEEYW